MRHRSGSITVVLSRMRPHENYSIVYVGSVHLLIIVPINSAAPGSKMSLQQTSLFAIAGVGILPP
jgi:hypothetical protein